MAEYLPRINTVTLLGALVLFFLPWTEIQCSGRHVATQSGLQAIYGGFSLSDDLQAKMDAEQGSAEPEDDIGYAYPIAIALLLVLVGTLMAGMQLLRAGKAPIAPGLLAALALALLALQIAIAFPVNREIARQMAESAASESDALAQSMSAMIEVRADRTNWFIFELLCLAIPAGLYLNSKLPRPRQPSAAVASTEQL